MTTQWRPSHPVASVTTQWRASLPISVEVKATEVYGVLIVQVEDFHDALYTYQKQIFTHFIKMVSLNNSEIILMFLEDDEDPDEYPVFFFTMEPGKYRIRLNWLKPQEGLLAADYDKNKKSHNDNVVFVVTQMTNAVLELLLCADGLLKGLHQGIKLESFLRNNELIHQLHQRAIVYDAALFKQRLAAAAADFKNHVSEFLNTIANAIGMKSDSTLILLRNEIRSKEWPEDDDRSAAPLGSLKYQDLLTEPIKGRLFVCWSCKYPWLLLFMDALTPWKTNHFLGMSFAKDAFTNIAKLSPIDDDGPVQEDDLGNIINDERMFLRALGEYLQENPFSIYAQAPPINPSP